MKRYIWMFLLTFVGIFKVHAQATLSIDDFKIKPGEEKEIAIKMTNTVPIRALQVQVVLPECISLVSRPAIAPDRQGSYTDDFGETVSAIKTLNYNKLNDGSCMITVNADDGVPFAGNEGAIITLKVKANENASPNESAITLKNIELVYKDGETYIRPSQSTCSVIVYQLFMVEATSSEGGNITGGGSYESGTKVTLTAIPDDGYRFVKWSDGSTDNPYTFIATENKSLTATFEAIPYYTIIYMVDGAEYKRVSVMSGSKIVAETNPVKEGHSFTGWSGLPEIMPEQDVTVTGRFVANSYEIIYMLDGEVFKTAYITYGTTITPPEAPAREGHTFGGWTGLPVTMPANDVTVTGSYTANSYTVTYMLNGELFKTEQVVYGTTIPTPEVPAKEGYNFSGWGEIPATMPARDLTFEGSYIINKDLKYHLIYMVDGTEYKRVIIAFGDAIILETAPTKEGHTFSGWSEVPESMPLHDVTVMGSFTVNKYLLTYTVDGEVYHTDSIAYGTSLTAIAAPVKEGYTFSGWIGFPETMPAKDVTVTGSFTVNKYLVTFKIGDEVISSDSLEYGSAIVAPTAPDKEGHTFDGWGEVAETVPAKNLTYEGSYSVNSYLLTYTVDGEVIHTDSIAYGTSLTALAAPVKEGYTFSGWIGLPETMPANDVTVTGSFVTNGYTLTYVVDGEVYKTILYEYNAVVNAEASPVKEGYTFSGWIGLPETMPAKDVTVTGSFTVNKYLVTFKIGDEVIASDSLAYGSVIVVPEAPDKEGHTFYGWGDVAETVLASDLTYEGSYRVNSYQLTYMVDGEVFYTDSIAYGTSLTVIVAPVKEGYTFSGWIGLSETMPAKDVTVTGSYTVNKYLVTFKIGDEVISSDSLEYGSAIVAPAAPDKEGHTFDGWGEVAETVPAKDLTYVGSYSVNSYLLTYTVDGEVIHTDSIAYGTSLTALAAPVKEGYTFSGWIGLPETMPANDVTVTGSFVTNGYTLTYVVDGEVYKTILYEYNAVVNAEASPVKEGYTFSGWIGLPEIMPAKDVTVTGSFTVNKYLVTFKIGDEVIASDSLVYGSVIVVPEAPDKEGHTFNGWGDVAETVPASDLTYEGSYRVNSYQLTYMVDGEVFYTDSIAYGTSLTVIVAPVKEGYTFSGWIGLSETMPAKDVTVTGSFTVNKYLVTFKIGDEVISSDSLEYGSAIVAPAAPDKEGHTFDGWGEVAETVPASDVIYEGSYTANIYIVYYYVGEELVHTAEVAYGEAIPEYIYEPTEEGYTFLGWIGETYETMPAHDVTYTANIESGINQLLIDNGQLTLYDLTGRKVTDTENLKGGIYIVNGKKVIIK